MSDSSRESTPLSLREVTPLSLSEIEEINEDAVSDKTIKSLLQKEIDLTLEIEAVESEIAVLEKSLNKDEEDEDQGKVFFLCSCKQ